MQYKLENEQLIPAPANFRTPDGKWICCFNQSVELMDEYGYAIKEPEAEEWRKAHPAPPPPPRTQCTKYELVTCLQTHFPELLARLREAYTTNQSLQFFWNSVLNLDRENSDFQAIADKLGITESELDEIFAKL